MKQLVAVMVALGLASLASPASAQRTGGAGHTQETGTRIPREARDVEDPAQANAYSKAVAECMYNRVAERVDSFLLHSDPINADTEAAGINWGQFETQLERCMEQRMDEFSSDVLLARVGMQYTTNRLRALLLEEAYLDRNSSAPVFAEGQSESAARSYVSTGEDLIRAQGLGRFADCVAYRDSAGADALLRTTPGSDAEMVAARALAPTLGDCLIAGQEIQFTPASIRAIAADGLWTRTTFGAAADNESAQ